MTYWREEEHPRADDGRFKPKNGRTETYEDDLRETLAKDQGIGYNEDIKLPKEVWAKFYARLGDIRHGEHFETTPNGSRKVTIDGGRGVLYDILFAGTFGRPLVMGVRAYSHDKAGRNTELKARGKEIYERRNKD